MHPCLSSHSAESQTKNTGLYGAVWDIRPVLCQLPNLRVFVFLIPFTHIKELNHKNRH
jgi:hypothetical protein